MKALKQRGAVVLREGRAHTVIVAQAGRQSTVPRHRDLDGATVRAIVKQLGLEWSEVQKEIT